MGKRRIVLRGSNQAPIPTPTITLAAGRASAPEARMVAPSVRTLVLACLLAVLFRIVGRRFWRWWSYDGDRLPADLVRRSS
jgi:hypothetical protein